MAPPPTPPLRPTPTPTPGPQAASTAATPLRTPASKHRLHFAAATPRNVNNHGGGAGGATEHPVEVIGRIRNLASGSASALEFPCGGTAVRVRGDAVGCRDFTLDGVSVSEDEDLEGFYRRFVRSRIQGVRVGAKCTVMVYGPTGSGKSHTMFGCAKQPGIVYRALKDILEGGGGGDSAEDDAGFGAGLFVQVAVLEIYNEEIYDLLVGNGAATAKGNAPKAKLEVMGKKAKNASYICGNEAGKISREVSKVEKRRTVKSTLCNERSSRSHCMIILDVPSVGGRLMLVDMAGSENIEAAGQTGFEAKMQTAKINQGNTALKRVVESIANGDSHVPFRDSKLTMLLQDSFEDDRSKILMILCASPDPKELHKTVSTLEYGAKAKCIIRAAHAATPRDKMSSEESSTVLTSRIVAMNQFIHKLQKEKKMREKECSDAQNVLRLKEEELAQVRAKLKLIEGQEREKTHLLGKMEETMLKQQQELIALRQQLQVVEREKADGCCQPIQQDVIGGRLMARLSQMPAGIDQSMAIDMSMDLDMGDQPTIQNVKVTQEETRLLGHIWNQTTTAASDCTEPVVQEDDVRLSGYPEKTVLSTVFEEGDEDDAEKESGLQEEVRKEVIEENLKVDDPATRKHRIENIFRLCGNYREMAKKPKIFGDENKEPSAWAGAIETPMCDVKVTDSPVSSQLSPIVCQIAAEESDSNKENSLAGQKDSGLLEVYIKWESGGSLIKGLKLLCNSSLSDLRKLIEAHFEEVGSKLQDQFTFLLLRDPSGAPVSRDKEASVQISRLPNWNNQPDSYLACLRVAKKPAADHVPFSPLDSKLNTLVKDAHLATGAMSPKVKQISSPKVNQMSPNYIRELRA